MKMSMDELIQTILALIFGTWFLTKYTIPQMLEWLDCMCIDETIEERSNHHDAG